MKISWKSSILAAAVAVGAATAANAAPLVDVQVLGSTTGQSGSYTSSLSVTPGEQVYYEVVGNIAPTGTTNSQKSYTLSTQVAGTDGISSIGLDMNGSDPTASVQSANLGSFFSSGLGSTAGTVSGDSVSGIYATPNTPGTFAGDSASDAVTVISGTLLAGSAANNVIGNNDFNAGNDGVKVLTTSGSKALSITAATEANSDPYIGFSALTLTEGSGSPVPAPGVVPALGALVAGLGLFGLSRRRLTI